MTRKAKRSRRQLAIPGLSGSLSRAEVARRLGVSYGAVRGWEGRGLLSGIRIGRGVYFDPSEVDTFARARESGEARGGAPLRAEPRGELDGLDPLIVRAALAALAKGAAPLDLALRWGIPAAAVRALVGEFQILRSLTAAPSCHRCEDQPATLCQECAAAAPFEGRPAATAAAAETSAAAV